jgi:hypothetical protein
MRQSRHTARRPRSSIQLRQATRNPTGPLRESPFGSLRRAFGLSQSRKAGDCLAAAWASSPREVYARSRVIRQRPSESTASDRCSRCYVPLPHSTNYRYLGVPPSGAGTPSAGPHVFSTRRVRAPGGPQCSLGLRALGLRGLAGNGARWQARVNGAVALALRARAPTPDQSFGGLG